MKLYSRNSFFKRMLLNIIIVIGWLLVVPISLFIPRKKGLIVSIGREGRYFLENVKYFFLFATKKKKNIYFLTENNEVYNRLKSKLPNIIKYPTLESIFLLMRAEYVVIDNTFWFRNFKFYLSIKAKKVQLWHGIGSKKINLSNPRLQNSKFKRFKILKGILTGELSKFYLFVSTSKYYNKHFKNSFRLKQIKEFGYPRNDVLFRALDKFDLLEVDNKLYSFLINKKENGYKVILYTPTFRDFGGDIFLDNNSDVNRLNKYAIDNKFIFIIKFHPLTKVDISNKSNVFVYDKYKDIYPILRLSDLMITDYSSIYLDFIILNRPIVFYIYDYEKYTSTDRDLRADFLKITPGDKCKSEEELFYTIKEILINKIDKFKSERKQILEMSYENIDDKSAERILNFII